METRLRIEAGQLDRAAVAAAELINEAERHGFDMWRPVGVAWQTAISALAAYGTGDVDPTALAAHIATFTTSLDALRVMEVNIFTTIYDGLLGRLLIAAGQLEAARERLDIGLAIARDTGMCFYDAELLRLRALTYDDPNARRTETIGALDLASRQTATLFELRAALDDFEFRGKAAAHALADVASRIPANNAWPELAWAQAALAEPS
jgi:predicted ATPase